MTVRKLGSHRSGQTLVVAIIILGILLILGFAFAGIINRNIREAGSGRNRSVAGDLARAGAEYAHFQMRYGQLGADWRPAATAPAVDAQGYTKDPDAYYTRIGDPTRPFSNDPRLANVPDLGGPDGYGPYTRVFFDRGRSLVRVRYAPYDYDAFKDPNGQLRQPGKARSYLIVETIGRPGQLRTGSRIDPSLELPERVKVTSYATLLEKTTELDKLSKANNTIVGSRKLMAFASIGIIETARFITDVNKTNQVAELGFPTQQTTNNGNRPTPFDQVGIGVNYTDGQAPYSNNPDDARPVIGTMVWGKAFAEPNGGSTGNWTTVSGGGSLYCNSSLKLYGEHDSVLNTSLGEAWDVAGKILSANSESKFLASRVYYDRAVDQWRSNFGANGSTVNSPILAAGGTLESDQPAFGTIGGILRDGASSPDSEGYARGIPRKDPPSILTVDPQNQTNRFLNLTRNSGRIVNGLNLGRLGYGRGPYVDSVERGNTNSEDERIISGSVKALPTDWLNPNNPNSQGWKGPYYIPLAAYMRLLPDGFEVVRDTRSRRPFWRLPSGQSSGSTKIRYRVRNVPYPLAGNLPQPMILNSIENPNLVGLPGAVLTDDDFRNFGQLFNGVVYFEGDVRVRGVIPTDQQLTVVSMGTVYVEGSVTKGVVTETGQVLTRPSRSAIMLAARDYVTLNPTMFFGPAAGETVSEKSENSVQDVPNPIELKLEEPDIVLESQFLLDPKTPASLGGNPVNPSTWRPYASHYSAAVTSTNLAANLLVSSSADDNGPAFVSFDVMPSSYALANTWNAYLFPRNLQFGATLRQFNAASEFFGGGANIPIYGLADPTLNSYPKFEAVEFPIVDTTFNFNGGRTLVPTLANLGSYAVAVEDPTLLRIRMNGVGNAPTKNFVFARTAIAPHEIRIEAALFAEQGSFFVIPGQWFNTNSQDSRRNWLDRTAGGLYPNMTNDEANLRRFELFGHSPSVPFYAEPLDVKVSIIGSVSENLPAPIGAQAEWLKKWGWIPRQLGSSGNRVPVSHTDGLDTNLVPALPNLTITYDPVFATAGVWDPVSSKTLPVRTDENGWALPPMPRLPVSPTLAYFGEVNP